ncbi:MAG: isoprenylcysteine carboxylmethyltransferase family protein [Erysipelotrichaceae bacterium]|nr:isoprenylcysteine carboxylmethyltransferase family protein [Erysipelotrichaceae bacterium]
MNKRLLLEAVSKYLLGVVLIGLLLFVPAGTLKWKNGWIFMGILFIPMLIAGLIMYFKAPDLLRSRLDAKEKQSEQKDVIKYSGLLFLCSFIIAGLNYRFKWTSLPDGIVILGIVVFLCSYMMFGEVLRENQYLSRTIKVEENQTVVDSGLYGIVRHPMYSASVLLFLSMPLVLNAIISFVIMLGYIPLIVKRIRNEEEVLEKELVGYTEYKEKVRYRLIPFIW